MTNYFGNAFKVGMKFIFAQQPYIIEKNEFVKPGKGQAFVRIKMRNLITEKLIHKTFKATYTLNTADIFENKFIYLYHDNHIFYYFMSNKNFEQVILSNKIVQNKYKWLLPQYYYNITFWNSQPIFLTLPKHITLSVLHTQTTSKKHTINNNTKQAKLSNGLLIKVPHFINNRDMIIIDIKSMIYISKAKY
ncbi:elongation factor P [Enterobacteriaceae endosymbiont of Macroplea appendiculata]|uniref:elongation factor P n=1 Tax=Enterobacteriaceae endosymbiont of Macroplea appendiculata TaxID=2675790 RepID=UPI00144A03F1|nr:elongation factor P [Enterobacteriaceae endosymbiont of Macroplea appendiculata]QJC30798.1 elongation factor P [Enterobacteriaceae endosymbiont of Macroplea appendiculata]